MKTKHTPGPWRSGRSDMQSFDGDSGFPFTNIYFDDPNGKFHLGERLPGLVGRAEGKNNKANACLMAAAPELLVATKDAYDLLLDYIHTIEKTGASLNYGHSVLSLLKSTIAVAEGTQPPSKREKRNG